MGDMFTSVGTNNSLATIDDLRARIAELEAVLAALVQAVDRQIDGIDPSVDLVQAMRDALSHCKT